MTEQGDLRATVSELLSTTIAALGRDNLGLLLDGKAMVDITAVLNQEYPSWKRDRINPDLVKVVERYRKPLCDTLPLPALTQLSLAVEEVRRDSPEFISAHDLSVYLEGRIDGLQAMERVFSTKLAPVSKTLDYLAGRQQLEG